MKLKLELNKLKKFRNLTCQTIKLNIDLNTVKYLSILTFPRTNSYKLLIVTQCKSPLKVKFQSELHELFLKKSLLIFYMNFFY
jgi:hypothetical protein